MYKHRLFKGTVHMKMKIHTGVILNLSDISSKRNSPKDLNDLRPVALTSLVMKSFEKLLKEEIVMQTEQALDPLQFSYRVHRGLNDAKITLLNLLYKHLEGSNTHARLLFINFSSAFNTIQPHILAMRLLEHF